LAGLVSLMVLAGCQSVIPKTKAPPAPTPAPQTGPVKPGLPTDEQRHRIALLVPMSGHNAAVGQSIANAANLALLDANDKKLRMTTYDTAPGAAAAAQRAINDGNRLFLGPLLATDVQAVSAMAAKAGIPIVSFSNDAQIAGKGVFVLGFSPDQSVRRVVDYASSQGLNRFVGLMPSGQYGQNASQMLIRAAEANGGRVVALQTYNRDAKSLTNAAKALASGQEYDAVLIADGGRLAAAAAPLLRKGVSPGARILGTELWNTDTAITRSSALQGAWYASVSDSLYDQLATKYRARYGKAPFRLASLGYDSVLLAVRIASDWKMGTPFPMRRLYDKGGFAGVDGAFRFGNDNVAERALAVHQIGTSGTTVVSPAPRGFGKD